MRFKENRLLFNKKNTNMDGSDDMRIKNNKTRLNSFFMSNKD